MRIEEATAFLYSLNPQGIRFGLENTRLVLEQLGRPQDSFRTIHLAGSNGKGSTAAFLDSLLRAKGLSVGLYTSPHLSHFRERFRVGGRTVDDAAIAAACERLLRDGLGVDPAEVCAWLAAENMVERMQSGTWYGERGEGSDFCRLTFFECTTIIAFLLFAEAGVEWAVVETGMGGRLDATNVLRPEATIITPISLEHTAWLGDTITAIAGEKAGIIKAGVPLVCGRQPDEARSVIARVAGDLGSPVSWLGEDIEVDGDWLQAWVGLGSERFGPLRLGLAGPHQVDNAAVAVGCLALLGGGVWPMTQADLAAGLQGVFWPGRFERFGEAAAWILDGAHNPDGARVLSETLRQAFPGERFRIVLGVLGDKDARSMLQLIEPFAAEMHLVKPRDARGRDPAELAGLLRAAAVLHATVPAAMAALAARAGPRVLVTGSLTVVGEGRDWLLSAGIPHTPLI